MMKQISFRTDAAEISITVTPVLHPAGSYLSENIVITEERQNSSELSYSDSFEFSRDVSKK
jgi:hypothetical protein